MTRFVRPGPHKLPPGRAPGGVVLRLYGTRYERLLTERIMPGGADDEAVEADATAAAEMVNERLAPDEGVVIVVYDGDSGRRWRPEELGEDWQRPNPFARRSELVSLTDNGHRPQRDSDWYDPMQAASKLGISGPALRALRHEGGLPDDGWRQVTKHRRRFTEYNPAVIDKMAISNSNGAQTVSEPATTDLPAHSRDRMRMAGADLIPLDEVSLEPRAIEALAAIGRLGPVRDEKGRVRSVVQDLMPNGASYTESAISAALTACGHYGLIKRELNGKRCYAAAITSRGRKWLAANRDVVPHIPDRGHGLATKEPEPAPEPEVVEDRADVVERPLVDDVEAEAPGYVEEAEANEERLATEAPVEPDAELAAELDGLADELEHLAEGAREVARVEAPSKAPTGPLAHPTISVPGLVAYAATNGPHAEAPSVDALLAQAIVAERDALRAHNATLQAHVEALTERAQRAEARVVACESALSAIGSLARSAERPT